ncbi:hypothetical protein EYC84_006922 [Monilinia fructicola]|uniref:Uncharacterized protein n=1 Tax=Monilinia fructicola TaxID=38448 RepID=A0A5M9K9V5_MONFR|nr:hypothetical protein EYC84_006922 [Monilinia fructicola]
MECHCSRKSYHRVHLGTFRCCATSGEVLLLKISGMNSNLSHPRCQFIHALRLDKTLTWDQEHRQGLPLRRLTVIE